MSDQEVDLGAAALVPTPKPQTSRTLKVAKRAARELMAQAKELEESIGLRRMCRGKVKLRDAAGEYLRDSEGNVLTRPCKCHAIKGGWVCPRHGGSAPQVKAKAEKRLNAMLEPSLIRMNELMHQDEHLPTALAAAMAVQNRVLGQAGKDNGDKDSRPLININIMPGGVPSPHALPQVVVATHLLPAAKVVEDDEVDGELVDNEEVNG